MSTMHKHDAAPLSVQQIIDAIVGCEASVDELSEMIAAALADARREGAEQMREDAAVAALGNCPIGATSSAEERAIRALPLPTGPRQAVLLTDEEIQQARSAAVDNAPDDVLMGRVTWLGCAELHELSRSIEAAALEKNGMEVRRG